MNPDKTAPLTLIRLLQRSSLIRVHSVCNIGQQIADAKDRADNKSRDWQQKGEAKINRGCIG